ncbi:Ras-related protein RABD2a [Apostasia shenzhenica]|uniref:Ras-related protein RABD2a n=1 Tax=Apostasia shenzhenica TaxID=1088818 RepID=A0A2I0A9B8_9ASPA|nr:Ras-related protein RABD2a [Apostasia shenzhenica]
MGREMAPEDGSGAGSLESRPGVLLIGCPNVGKRTLLSRLLSIDFPDIPNISSEILCQGWTLETKYYSVDLSIWSAHLDEEFSLGNVLASKQLEALVMVFDINDESSFLALKKWVAGVDIGNIEILLCVGNKVDLVPGHFAHAEYRRQLQKHGESVSDPHPEFWDYGINETESFSLLGKEDASVEIKKSCMEWCIEHNIEFIEACASNADFDKCLSVEGDSQGVERLHGALSAHMWPGMVLKPGNSINVPTLFGREDTTDDESDVEIEYEVLSAGPEEQWDNSNDPVASSSMPDALHKGEESDEGIASDEDQSHENVDDTSDNLQNPPIKNNDSDYKVITQDQKHAEETEPRHATSEVRVQEGSNAFKLDEDEHYGYEDLERLMFEIGNIRGNLRLMPDFQRREMAANLATKMAAMFGENSDEDDT